MQSPFSVFVTQIIKSAKNQALNSTDPFSSETIEVFNGPTQPRINGTNRIVITPFAAIPKADAKAKFLAKSTLRNYLRRNQKQSKSWSMGIPTCRAMNEAASRRLFFFLRLHQPKLTNTQTTCVSSVAPITTIRDGNLHWMFRGMPVNPIKPNVQRMAKPAEINGTRAANLLKNTTIVAIRTPAATGASKLNQSIKVFSS